LHDAAEHATKQTVNATRIGFVGFGKFGRAFAELLEEAGLSVRYVDPHAFEADPRRMTSLGELAAWSEVVVLATPALAMRTVLQELVPYLTPDHLVCDVASVKLVPWRALADILGDRIPWVATHPLFGPVSLARAERPLRVVVCPQPRFPDAQVSIEALFERVGCTIVRRDPDDHDRGMADTHALAFFVAKGVLEGNFPVDAPDAPPSFQAIARTVQTVRADAGHLFATIELDNPHAKTARSRLLEALGRVHDQLENASTVRDADADEARMSMPPPLVVTPVLVETRTLIDEIDREILALLAQRAELGRRAGAEKERIGRAIRDRAREEALLQERRAWAQERSLDGDAVASVFDAIMHLSRRVQGA
jgi:prephenate dehydrogenase